MRTVLHCAGLVRDRGPRPDPGPGSKETCHTTHRHTDRHTDTHKDRHTRTDTQRQSWEDAVGACDLTYLIPATRTVSTRAESVAGGPPK